MILHLLTDDKFSDYVVEQFSAKEMCSEFVLLSDTSEMIHYHYLDKSRLVNPWDIREIGPLSEDFKRYNAVVFHGYFLHWQEWLLNRWPEGVKLVWVCWGGEIYGQPDIKSSFLMPISKFINFVHRLGRKRGKKDEIFPKALIAKSDYCMTNVKEEYEFVKKYLRTNIKHLWFTYYSINEMIGPLMNERCAGNNIFMGNSASIENNYFDVWLRLKRIGIGDRKIITPLSYGSPWAKNVFKKWGKVFFGENFNPLVDFMPRTKYNAYMLSCPIMIQAHRREQAHGNIVTGIWLGMRVYLSEKGIDYKHFKSIGCRVYSIEKDLHRRNPDVFAPMTDEDVAHNRRVLLAVYGREHIDAENRKLVKQLA